MRSITLISILLLPVYAFAGEFPTIAVIDFSSKGHTDLTYILPNLLSEELLDTEMFDVLEREICDQSIAEVFVGANHL